MNQPQPSHEAPAAPKRPALARLVGRVVAAEGVLCRPYRDRNGKRLRLVQDCIVYPNIALHHAWIDLPTHVLRRLRYEQRFSFTAEVVQYRRSDSSKDYGLSFVAYVQQGRAK